MPAKIKHARITSGSRCNTHRRKNKEKQRRPRRRGLAASAPAVIANSLFALTLKPKGWADIHGTVNADHVESGHFRMYKDLIAAYNQAADKFGKDRITYDKKINPVVGSSAVLKLFKDNICPAGFEVNIDEHRKKGSIGEHFHFTIYKALDFPWHWHFFEIKQLVNKLNKENKKLHDFFIVFLKSFIDKCILPTWYNGGIDRADMVVGDHLYSLQQTLIMREQEEANAAGKKVKKIQIDPWFFSEEYLQEPTDVIRDRIESIQKTVDEYSMGPARIYSEKIHTAKAQSPELLLKSLKKFSSRNYLVKFMKQACEFMKLKATLLDFCYHQTESYYAEGLGFDMQVCVIWDCSDHFSQCHMEDIDSLASGTGVFPPTLNAKMIPDKYEFDKKAFLASSSWPVELHKLWKEYLKITDKLSKRNNY